MKIGHTSHTLQSKRPLKGQVSIDLIKGYTTDKNVALLLKSWLYTSPEL